MSDYLITGSLVVATFATFALFVGCFVMAFLDAVEMLVDGSGSIRGAATVAVALCLSALSFSAALWSASTAAATGLFA